MFKKSFTVLLFTLLNPTAWAAPPCDTSLRPVSQPALAYKARGADRCEGFYESQVSRAGSLQLVGLMQGRLPAAGMIELSAPHTQQHLKLRATALPEKTYYRLDAALQPGKTLSWPSRIFTEGGVQARDIGVYAYLANAPKVYAPVQINQGAAQTRLLLQASEAMIRLNWRYALLKNGQCGAMKSWREINQDGGFTAAEVIPVVLPEIRALCLEAAGQTRGSQWLSGLWRIQVH
ncbi:hypothetical protein [Candidatus Venteria ishoeyi]|uniref:Uncharacterized protein n=1 Tax=Candidatus Venteria ishoeyi TaxID=1899563 RepID=A0A1H6FB31_9GAMM|nr:hypothetical protein [Candidatus Venteria ishoeyi]SEH06336.1 Uncharacterised protein [Candidatus Venteria ishoeyi]